MSWELFVAFRFACLFTLSVIPLLGLRWQVGAGVYLGYAWQAVA